MNVAKNSVIEYSFKQSDVKGKLQCARRVLPEMCQKRMKHSSFIARNYLFVLFGHRNGKDEYSTTVEYLDLVDEPIGAEWKELKL